MSNYLNLALSRWDRVFLFADGVLRFRPNPQGKPPRKGGTNKGRPSKYGNPNGTVRRCAKQYLDGFYGEQSIEDVALVENLGYDSFYATIWKIRSDRKKEKL